uniref:KIF-binding protein n=1 Tax=Serinus canaria TaxID=9135 RepID=A0A8C9NVP6_SERCA
MDHCAGMCVCLSVHPSILPTGASLHPPPSLLPFPWAGSSHLAGLKCIFGEILPVFLTREPAAGAGQGGCRVCLHLPWVPAPRSPPHLPGVSPARHFALWSGSVPSLTPKCVSIFICPGDGPGCCCFCRFEKAYTHTLYYLAQVYQHLDMIEKAAQYCHTTLKRQLEYCGYYPVEWARNAATLSQYYLSKECFMEARHCLAAASVIFSQAGQVPSAEDYQQDLPERKAEIARCWIKYCLNLLQSHAFSFQDNIGELDPDRQLELKAQRKKEEDEKEKGRKKAVLFGTSDISDSVLAMEEKVSSVYPLDFQEAREVFLVGQNYVQEAKEFFQVDGYVTDHIEIVQDHSALFKVLAFFEEDYERRCKMHKRRIDMLEPIYTDLNPQYYLLVRRQLQCELADTYYEMMDLKVAIGNRLEKLDSHTVKKINSLAQFAIKYYELFLDSLRNPDKVFPEKLEEDVLRPAMVAKFHIARLYGKLITSDSKKQLENMQTSLEYYTFLVDYCEKYPDAVPAIETELELSKEMVNLLPASMERLRAKVSSFV